MRTMLVLALLGAVSVSTQTHAQVTYDMSKVTCADYNAMDPGTSSMMSAWTSGWFNQQAGSTTLNLEGYAANVASVSAWCAKNPNQLLLAALKTSVANAKPGIGGPTSIDGAAITCNEFLKSSPDTKALVGSWMGGWFMSTKNLTIVDARYVKRNLSVIETYCKQNGKTKLMTALDKKWK